MGLPSEFMLTDVRCFAGEQRARLRPITLLVGENSTGKTTFLGCYNMLLQLFVWPPFHALAPDFNREPFSMGSFGDIVRTKRSSQQRIRKFGIGLKLIPVMGKNVGPYSVNFTFMEHGYQPAIKNIRYEFGKSSFLELTPKDNGAWNAAAPFGAWEIRTPLTNSSPFFHPDMWSNVPLNSESHNGHDAVEILDFMSYMRDYLVSNFPNIVSFAPLRSKPKRTYDPVQEVVSPEGVHVPMLMMRLDRTKDDGWKPLHRRLSAFGAESGMFSDIRVRRLGKQMSDPFQLQVKARSEAPANIMDVGYGVSQSLPILVDIHSHTDSLFLLQQPEVHLHPRAQAELATVFAASARENGNSFMIETHSDHIVDRMRILVRQGKIPAEDVSILYFEPVKNAVQIHNIEVDGDGNLENVPPGYRDFFLRESDRLLGFED